MAIQDTDRYPPHTPVPDPDGPVSPAAAAAVARSPASPAGTPATPKQAIPGADVEEQICVLILVF